VPALTQDRFLTPDIQAVYKLLASSELLKRTKGGMAANE